MGVEQPVHVSDIIQSLLKSVSGAAGPALVALATWIASQGYSRWKQRRESSTHALAAVQTTHAVDLQIRVKLLILLQSIRATRVYIGKFHNGEKYVDNSDILKLTRTHEVVAPGVSYTAQQYVNVLTSLIPEETRLISEVGPSFTVISSLADGRFRYECEQFGIIAICRCPIRKGKDIVGYVGADFYFEIPPPNIGDVCRVASDLAHIIQTSTQ